MKFREFIQPYLFSERAIIKSAASLTKKLQDLYQSKLGYVLSAWPGLDFFVNDQGSQKGIKFFVGDSGAFIRFNVDDSFDVESIDIFNDNPTHPIGRIVNLTSQIVLQAADQIAHAIKTPKAFFNKELQFEESFDDETVPIEEMAQPVEWNGTVYPTKTKVIEAMLIAGHTPNQIIAALGVSGPQVYNVRKQLAGGGGQGGGQGDGTVAIPSVTVVAGSPEQSADPSYRQAYKVVSSVRYADPETVFDDLLNMVDMVILGVSNSLIVCGEKGIGKTTEITNRIQSHIDRGNISKDSVKHISGAKLTEKGLYELLFHNYDRLIIFDDSDSVMKSEDKINMLKAALDTREPRKIEWYSKGTFDPASVTEDQYNAKIDAGDLPQYFAFNGKVIFITNQYKDKIDEAIASRSIVFDIRLKLEDKWHIIRSKLSVLCSDVDGITDEDRQKAFDYMKNEFEGDADLRSLVKGIKIVSTFRRTNQPDAAWQRVLKHNM